MSDDDWARHANPWSVWTRTTVLPVLILAVWSRVWLGWWALLPVAVAAAWMWVNPRIFPKPGSTNNWASKGVLGERVWLNRDVVPIPAHHRTVPNVLSAISAVGMVFVIWGLIALNPWPVVLGAVVVYLGKLWFLDRMVWLFSEMVQIEPSYKKWLY